MLKREILTMVAIECDSPTIPSIHQNGAQFVQPSISSVYLRLACISRSHTTTTNVSQSARDDSSPASTSAKVIVPVLVKVIDINDNAPRFSAPKFSVQVNELAPLGTIVLGSDSLRALDLDSANNALIEYSLYPFSGSPNRPLAPAPASSAEITTTTQTPSSTTLDYVRQRKASPVATAARPIGMAKLQRETIDLQNEPILNGPMDESDEESDESLLASLANSTFTSTLASGSDQPQEDPSAPTTEMPSDSAVELTSGAAQVAGIEGGPSRIFTTSTGGASRSRKRRQLDREASSSTSSSSSSYLMTSSSSSTTQAAAAQLQQMTTSQSLSPRSNEATGPLMSSVVRRIIQDNASQNNNNNYYHYQQSHLKSSVPWTNLMDNNTNGSPSPLNGANLPATGSSSPSTTTTSNMHNQLDSGWNQATALSASGDLLHNNNNNNDHFDSTEFFALELTQFGPVLKLKKQLDFESRPLHQLIIVASDRPSNKSERLTGSALIQISVTDGDDQGPAFLLEQSGCATNAVPSNSSPSPIAAVGSSTRPPAGLAGGQSDPMHAAASALVAQMREAGGPRLSGFKVTELSDDFDFGDSADQHNKGAAAATDQLLQHSVVLIPETTAYATTPTRQNLGQAKSAVALSTMAPPNESQYSCLPAGSSSGVADYWASVMAGDSDQLVRIGPQSIRARDRDLLNAPIQYSFLNGTPANYSSYFQINPLEAWVKQIAPIDRVTGQPDRFVIWLEAQEQTPKRHSSVARLTIDVKPADWSPPSLYANSYAGFLNENSPLGSRVWASKKAGAANIEFMRIQLQATTRAGAAGSSFGPPPDESYEFETTSDTFKVDNQGFVYVAQSRELDADVPGVKMAPVFMFQVTAKPVASSRNGLSSSQLARSMSIPISVNVTLLDLDDNGPQLVNSSFQEQPIQLLASSQTGVSRHVATIQAVDHDLEQENWHFHFNLLHVSNGGRDRFRLNESSGELRALGKFVAGEQFSLTIQVSDLRSRSSQSILELVVVPGPNLGAPQFVAGASSSTSADAGLRQQAPSADSDSLAPRTLAAGSQQATVAIGDFSVDISEASAPRSAVFQLHAQDPENDPIAYGIVAGNINQDFGINPHSGLIFLNNKLDREEVSQYHLLVQARDSGGLTSTRGLRINVLDTNDENPVFSQQSYEFSVSENAPLNSLVGHVQAHDGDAADFGRLTYSLESDGVLSDEQRSSRPLFSIDRESGQLRLNDKLDYERAKSHLLIIKAQDQDRKPRSSNCRVLVRVLDAQDELPYFEHSRLQLRLWENQVPGDILAQLEAHDPDSVAQITYELKWSSADSQQTTTSNHNSLFSVDPRTGAISTSRSLDFEQMNEFTLIVGTKELQLSTSEVLDWSQRLALNDNANSSMYRRAPVCRVDIQVLDLNDNAPKFQVEQLIPIRVKNSVPPGTEIGRFSAQDADGSAPNNQIRYELLVQASAQSNPQVNSYCNASFHLDATTGSLSVKSDLNRQSQSECQLEIRARDLGLLPSSLSSQAALIVYIDHIAEIPSSGSSLLGFADSQFMVEVGENLQPGSLIKILPVVGQKQRQAAFPFSCELISGNELGAFQVSENSDRDCELRLSDKQSVDFEQRKRHLLTIRLNTIGGSSSNVASAGSASATKLHPASGQATTSAGAKQVAQVVVLISDRNDNKPAFKVPSRYSQLTQGKLLAVIPEEAPTDFTVCQVRASDLDQSPSSNGLVSYELLRPELQPNELAHGSTNSWQFIRIDPLDGTLKTTLPVEDIKQRQQLGSARGPGSSTIEPLRVKVLAHDNPDQANDIMESTIEVVINILEPRHRLALVLEGMSPSRAVQLKEELLSILQERSGLISGLERVESLKQRRNGSLSSSSSESPDPTGTDLWFYLIEPGSLRLIESDDQRIIRSLLDPRAQLLLDDVIRQRLSFTKTQGQVRIKLPPALHSDSSQQQMSKSSGGGGWFLSSVVDGGNGGSGASFAARLLLSISSEYSRAAADHKYASLLISAAILIGLSATLILVFRCGSRVALRRQRIAQSNESARFDKLAAHLMASNQSANGGPLFPAPSALSPQSYFLPLAPDQQQQAQIAPTNVIHSSSNPYSEQTSTEQLYAKPNANGAPYAATRSPHNKNQQSNPSVSSSTPSQQQQQTLIRRSKEYETQMLKMSVIYDDNQSVEGHHGSTHIMRH